MRHSKAPYAVARERAGNIYIGEKRASARLIRTASSPPSPARAFLGTSGDGGHDHGSRSQFCRWHRDRQPGQSLYFSEDQARIRRIAPDGTISHSRDGEGWPGLAVDAQDRLYVAKPSNADDPRDHASTARYPPLRGPEPLVMQAKAGRHAEAQLDRPSDLAFDAAWQSLYRRRPARCEDRHSRRADAHRGRTALPIGTVSLDEVPATQSSLTAFSVATDPQGDVFVATPRVRKIKPDGIIHAFAGIETSQASKFQRSLRQRAESHGSCRRE